MTVSAMADLAAYLHREARAKYGPGYDPGAVNQNVTVLCLEQDLDPSQVIGRMFARACDKLALTYQETV